MRTVHETEQLRPSDPVPRNYNSAHFKPQRLKLTLKPPTAEKGEGDSNATLSPPPDEQDEEVATIYEYPADVTFSEEELLMPPSQLFRLLRRKVNWSEQRGEILAAEVGVLETKQREEWLAKELVLTNLMEAEVAVAHRKGEDEEKVWRIVEDDLPEEPLPLIGKQPWYRQIDAEEEMRAMEEAGSKVDVPDEEVLG